MLTLSEAAFIALVMEALLFGVSLVMFMMTLWIVLRKRSKRRPNYILVVSACVLQSLACAELINNIVRAWQGILDVGLSSHSPGTADLFFADFTGETFVTKSVLYNVQTMILDGIVIYRTFLVWGNFYVVILPILGWIGIFAGTIGLNLSLVHARENRTDVFAGAVGDWITSVYALTLATNLSASTLLAYRVWSIDRASRRYKANNVLGPVLLAVIESGALYSVAVTAALVCFVVKTPGVYVVLDMLSPIICIVFNMIIVRIAFASGLLLPSVIRTRNQDTTVEQSGSGDRRRTRPFKSDEYHLRSLAVEVTRYVETDVDTRSVNEVDRKFNGDEEFEANDAAPSRHTSGLAV